MKFSCWVFDDPRPEDLMEDGTTATFTMQEDIGVLAKFSTLEEDDSSADFGTIAAATAVVGVVGATAYLVGTEVALNQLLPAGTSVPQDRAQLALLLWNTAGRPGACRTARLCGRDRPRHGQSSPVVRGSRLLPAS